MGIEPYMSLIPAYEELLAESVELAKLNPPIQIPQFPNVNMTMQQAFTFAVHLKRLTELRAIRSEASEAAENQHDLLVDILDKLNDIHEELRGG